MDAIEQLRETCTNIQVAWDAFKSENNAQVAKAVKDGIAASDGGLAATKLANMQQAIDDLTGKRADLEARVVLEAGHREELERKLNLLRVQPGDKTNDEEVKFLAGFNVLIKAHARDKTRTAPADLTVDEYRVYRKAFDRYIRVGDRMLDNDEVKSLQVGVDPDGGYLVPVDYSGQLVKVVFDLSPIRQIASVQEISSDRLDGIEDTGEAAAGWVSEVGARPATATPQVGRWEIVAQELYAAPQATQRLLDDAAIDAEAWLAMKVADKFARVEGTAFCVGTGVGQPRGFTTYPTAATGDNTRAWGTLETIGSGAAGAFVADPNGGDPLFDLVAAFRPPYLNNARWITRRSVIAKIRKMKATTGNYLWNPGLQVGVPDSLIGYPIVMAEDMPALAAGSLSLGFGDFKQAYQIVDRLGVRTLRDPFTNKPYVIFYTTRRVGGAVLNYQSLKFLKFA